MEFQGQQIGVVLCCCFDPAADDVCEISCVCCIVIVLFVYINTTFSDGCLGLDNDEGRSEV